MASTAPTAKHVTCPVCSETVLDNEDTCSTCGHYAGAPNVRTASRVEECQALVDRYDAACQRADASGTRGVLDDFEASVQGSAAVINADPAFIFPFVSSGKMLYSTYGLSVNGETRAPADPDDDRNRRGVEGILFGTYGQRMRYAALTLDGWGLTSYGSCAMRLRDVAIRNRASLLEENSYDFVEHHDLTPRRQIPPGYRSTWDERHRLAVAKLAGALVPSTTPDEYPEILLFSEGDRSTDRFMEVQIYGPFGVNAVESVKGRSDTKGKGRKADIGRIKDALRKAGKAWIEG